MSNEFVLGSRDQDYRYERKSRIETFTGKELENLLQLHPFSFRKIHNPRNVNNIYFDSHDFNDYHDNVDGSFKRVKARIRWYGPLLGDIINPNIELKIKLGSLGTKWLHPLPAFRIVKHAFDCQKIMQTLNAAELPPGILGWLNLRRPVLLSCYHRNYYLSASKKFRVTIDSNMLSYRIRRPIDRLMCKQKDLTSTIMELKYAKEDDAEAHAFFQSLPFRITRMSKYISGVNPSA